MEVSEREHWANNVPYVLNKACVYKDIRKNVLQLEPLKERYAGIEDRQKYKFLQTIGAEGQSEVLPAELNPILLFRLRKNLDFPSTS